MDRASFYTNASGSLKGNDPEPRSFPGESLNHPQSSVRSEESHAFVERQRYPPIYQQESDDRFTRTYGPPRDRLGFEPFGRSGPSHQAPAGLVSPSYPPRRRRSQSPPLLPPRHQIILPHERPGYGDPPMHPPMVLERGIPVSRSAPSIDIAPHANPLVKHPRVSLACLACRNRKSRCDGNRPICKTCAHMKVDCKWPEVDFRRAKTGDPSRQRRKSARGNGQPISPPESSQSRHDYMLPQEEAAPPASGMVHAMSRYQQPHTSALSISSLSNPVRHVQGLDKRSYDRGKAADEEYQRSMCCSGSPAERYMHTHGSEEQLHSRLNAGSRRAAASPTYYKHGRVESARPSVHEFGSPKARISPQFSSRHYLPSVSARGDHYQRPQLAWQAAVIQVRDFAAELLALDRKNISTSRHGTAHSQRSPLPAGKVIMLPSKTESERLDEVYSADWSSIGIPRSFLTRDFSDAMAGITGYIEKGAGDEQAGLEAILHLFRVLSPGQSSRFRVERISLPLLLPENAGHEFLHAFGRKDEPGPPVTVKSVGLDLKECLDHTRHLKEEGRSELQRDAQPASSSQHISCTNEGEKQASKMTHLFKGDLPKRKILVGLIDVLFANFGKAIPCVDEELVKVQAKDGSICPCLANVFCAMATRYTDKSELSLRSSGEAFVKKARQLFGNAMLAPTPDSVRAAFFLSVVHFSSNRANSALPFLAAATRMAIELGLHHAPPADSILSDKEKETDAILFWTLLGIDRITSLLYATPLLFKEGEISLPPLPKTVAGKPNAFAYLIQHLFLVGRLVEPLNSPTDARYSHKHWAAEREANKEDLQRHYDNLPPCLRFPPQSADQTADEGDASVYMSLHLAHHASILLSYLATKSAALDARGLADLRHSSRKIGKIAEFCCSRNKTALNSAPMISPCFFIAGCVSLAEIKYLSDDVSSFDRHSPYHRGADISARANLKRCIDFLESRAALWLDAEAEARILKESLSQHEGNLSSEAVRLLLDQVRLVRVLPNKVDQDGLGQGEPYRLHRVTDPENLAPFMPGPM